MKRVIAGVRYNSETTPQVASWDNGLGDTDFGACEESLHRTTSGRYFIYGRGGALSSWSQPCGNNARSGGSGIAALTPQEALEWLEIHNMDVPVGCPEIEALVVDA